MHFKKHGPREQRNGRAYRGIEALQMPSLSDAFVSGRKLDQLVCLSQRRGQRLLDEDVYPSPHKSARHFKMMNRRRCHGCSPHFAVRRQHLLDRAEGSAPELARHRVRPVQIRIDHANQANGFTLLLQFLVNASMIASKDAHTHYRDGNRTFSLQENSRMAGCRGNKEL
jgi:hypothetical protein